MPSLQVLSHFKEVRKPTWQNVMSRVYTREIISDFRNFAASNKQGHQQEPAVTVAGNSSVVPVKGKSVMYIDPLDLSSIPNLDTMCSNAPPRLGWMKAGRVNFGSRTWNINTSIFSGRWVTGQLCRMRMSRQTLYESGCPLRRKRLCVKAGSGKARERRGWLMSWNSSFMMDGRPREVDSKDYFDCNPRAAESSKKRSIVPRAFEADVARASIVETLKRYTTDPADHEKVGDKSLI